MIDAPDHAAQERGNRSAGAWLLVALLGIALSVVAGMMSYGYTTAQAEQRFADVVDYVATQSLSYDAFNSAYTTKNLIRLSLVGSEMCIRDRRAIWSATARWITPRWSNMPTSST